MSPQSERLLRMIILGSFLTGALIATSGLGLVLLGSGGGVSSIIVLGQSIQTTHGGIGAIFLGTILILLNVRAVLKHLEKAQVQQQQDHSGL